MEIDFFRSFVRAISGDCRWSGSDVVLPPLDDDDEDEEEAVVNGGGSSGSIIFTTIYVNDQFLLSSRNIS